MNTRKNTHNENRSIQKSEDRKMAQIRQGRHRPRRKGGAIVSVTETRAPVIVANEAEFTETLFKPIDGRTADGYVIRRGKRFVDIWLCGKKFRVNRYLVLCEQGDNGAWYHGILSVPFGFGALTEAFEKLALGSEWQGMDRVYFFN